MIFPKELMNMHPHEHAPSEWNPVQFSCYVDMCIKIQGVCVQLDSCVILLTGMYDVVYHRPAQADANRV